MRELIRRNRDEMQDRRRAGAKTDHNPLGTRTYTLAVRDEEENNYDSNDEEAGIPRGGIEDSSDEEAGIQRGGIEDSSDEEAGIQRGGIEDSSDEEEGIQRGGIEEEVNQNDCLSENAAETDDNAAPKIALKKTGAEGGGGGGGGGGGEGGGGGGGGGGEASVSARTTLAMEPAARAETRDDEGIELNTLKSHETGANNDAQKIIVTVDVHVPRVDAAYPDVEMAPAPVKRKLQKNGSKTRKIGQTVSGGKDKAAADIPGVKPSDRAGNTGMDRKMGADRSDEDRGAVDIRAEELSGQACSNGRRQQTGAGKGDKRNAAPDIPDEELSGQACSSGRSQQTGAGRDDKKKAAPDISAEELSGQACSIGRSQQTGAGRDDKKKAAPKIPAEELSDQAEDNGIDPKMGAANDGKELTPTSSVGAVHDGSGLQASVAEKGFSVIKKRSNWKRRVNLAGNAKKKP